MYNNYIQQFFDEGTCKSFYTAIAFTIFYIGVSFHLAKLLFNYKYSWIKEKYKIIKQIK